MVLANQRTCPCPPSLFEFITLITYQFSLLLFACLACLRASLRSLTLAPRTLLAYQQEVKGMAERGLGQDKRERGEGRERKERSGSGTRQQPNLELQHLITYQSTHTPKKYFSFSTMYSFYPHPTKTN